MKKAVIYSGFARSGKSTLVNRILKELGFQVLDTSSLLHEFALNLLEKLTGCVSYDTENKNPANLITISANGCSKTFTAREFLIEVAENVCVAKAGRQFFPMLMKSKADDSNGDIAVSTIGGDEFRLIYEMLQQDYHIILFNVRRSSEQSGVDKRELIPGAVYIWNEGSYEDLKNELRTKLEIGI